jgi:hypothetical protein
MTTTNTIANAAQTVGTLAHQPKHIKGEFAGTAVRIKKIMDREAVYEQAPGRPAIAISKGNVKMGDVPSVSLPPVVTCPNCSGCAKQCYYIRNCCMYPAVLNAVARNLALWRRSPGTYFNSVIDFVKKSNRGKGLDAFRWHVGGDIPNGDYLQGMIKVAEACPETKFLAFTKNYKAVNEAADQIPANLQIIFSAWPGIEMDNPHDFPTSSPLFDDGTCAETDGKTVHMCGGNCRKCFEAGEGCWTLKRGEAVVFPAH